MTNEVPEWLAPEDPHPLHLHEPISSSQVSKQPTATTPIPPYFPGGLFSFPPIRFPQIDLNDIQDVRQLPDAPRGPARKPRIVRHNNDYYLLAPGGWCRIQTDCNAPGGPCLTSIAFAAWADESVPSSITNSFTLRNQVSVAGLLSLAYATSLGSYVELGNAVGAGTSSLTLNLSPAHLGAVLMVAIVNHTFATNSFGDFISFTDSQGGAWDNGNVSGTLVNWATLKKEQAVGWLNGHNPITDSLSLNLAWHQVTQADIDSGLDISISAGGDPQDALAAFAVELFADTDMTPEGVYQGFGFENTTLSLDTDFTGSSSAFFHDWNLSSPESVGIGVWLDCLD